MKDVISVMRGLRGLVGALLIGHGGALSAQVDPLTVRADVTDAARFAAVFARTGGSPDAAALQHDYLDGGGRGIAIFTPNRIENATNLARAIAADRRRYAYAIETCLPLISELDSELRAVYLAYRGLLPARPLPAIHIVFGAGNSGGTAQAEAQVIGLEVMCGPGTTPDQFKRAMRSIYAHETAHSLQVDAPDSATADKLMFLAISEGGADFLAALVTGRPPSVERETYGLLHEGRLWAEFQRDRVLLQGRSWEDIESQPLLNAALRRWFWNAGDTPQGIPAEMGYWIGMRVAAATFAAAPDKRAIIGKLLARADPSALAAAGGYSGNAVPAGGND